MDNFVLSTGGSSLQEIEGQIASRNFNLDGLIDVLKNLLDLRAAQIPEIARQYQIPVTSKVAVIDSTVIPSLPWINFTINCDGPGSVFCFVNEKKDIRDHDCLNSQQSNTCELQMGESKKYTMQVGSIQKIFLQCATGYTSNVRIFSMGKRPYNQEVDVNEL